ncbi:MAG: flagellar hook assembly protein FlgD [Pseudomonadota bacterium]
MTSSVSSSNPYADIGLSAPPAQAAKTNELGQDDFLKLMTTQLTHQDPFEPMENGEFLAQMAQFSTVSGIQGLQQSVTSLVSSLQGDRVLQASSLVGKKVLIEGSKGELFGSVGEDGKAGPGSLSGAVDVPVGVSSVTLAIQNANGEVLNTQTMTVSGSGLTDFSWDGKLADGSYAPAGTYKVVAQATVNGKSQDLTVQTASAVSSVSLANDAIMLHTAQGSVALDKVSRILA